jgi:hypothetical protein
VRNRLSQKDPRPDLSNEGDSDLARMLFSSARCVDLSIRVDLLNPGRCSSPMRGEPTHFGGFHIITF